MTGTKEQTFYEQMRFQEKTEKQRERDNSEKKTISKVKQT